MSIIRRIRGRLTSVGIKILIGVALASNLFIGALLYVHMQSSTTIEEKVNAVLTIKENLSANLRTAIVKLQNEFLSLPEFFKTDVTASLLHSVEQAFPVTDRQLLKGRDRYTELFDRHERRDLSKGGFIIQTGNGKLRLSHGLLDDSGNFKDEVEQLTLGGDNPDENGLKLRALLDSVQAESTQGTVLKQKVNELGAKVADAGLAAENTRNEILQHVEEIREMEHELTAFSLQQRHFSLLMGGLAILANMVVLFLLVRMIVERPLHKLTSTIDAINSGKFPDIPYRQRHDQIGILSGAINNFREALIKIQGENQRKAYEKILVEEMFATITSVVNTLENRAKELVSTANSLKELASSTEERAENVSNQAGETAQHTIVVSESTVLLQSTSKNINEQVLNQESIVASILKSSINSRQYFNELNTSIQAIGSIIASVEEITDQTKLLSLNATIEAARAGTAGEGFSVVANEIKALSAKTATATQDAKIKIKAIEEARLVLLNHVEENDARIEALNQRTSNITQAVYEQRSVTDTIANLSERTSKNTGNVSLSISGVRSAAARTRTIADQVHDSSLEISEQLTTLLKNTTARLQQLAMGCSDPQQSSLPPNILQAMVINS